MAKASASATPAVPRRSWFWLQGVICGVAVAVVPGTALMIGVLMAPAFATYAMEQGKTRPLARGMMLRGAACTFMPLRVLWEHGGSLDASLDLLSDPGRPLLAWTACGAGWLAGQLADILTRLALDARSARALRQLTQERDKLIVEWTDEQPPK
ncbi:hypothetical protein [Acidisphaera sp. L21]|uniref:hypothetical protein n=1 Tax=Acidisphaera sp. L21 TaxID=1641851 RepID=UPI00131CB5D5|nr:hypothetical protein [Acidisphaera sp. L21]